LQLMIAYIWNKIIIYFINIRECDEKTGRTPRVLMITNNYNTIYKKRTELIQELKEKGCEVWLKFPHDGGVELIQELGCHTDNSTINRRKMNLLEEYHLLMEYNETMNRIKPDIVLTYTIKCNLYGGFVAASQGIPYIPNITGLGRMFNKNRWIDSLLRLCHKVAFRKASCVFFQNTANCEMLKDTVKGRLVVLPGSGVNIHKNAYVEYPPETENVKFIFIGRIEEDKGIFELAKAAGHIYIKYPEVRFLVLGENETDAQEKATLDTIFPMNMEILGWKADVNPYIAKCHAIILPSHHEGMANVLLEAAALGRPILASRIPGCMETLDEGISGIGFEPRNVDSLIEAIEAFINFDYARKKEMGVAARRKIRKEFDRRIVVEQYWNEISAVLGRVNDKKC